MKNNKIAIESLSMDLYRVAMGYHRGSIKMADRFREEALKRVKEIDTKNIEPYFVSLLLKVTYTLSLNDNEQLAEDALMYSTRCRNYAKHFC